MRQRTYGHTRTIRIEAKSSCRSVRWAKSINKFRSRDQSSNWHECIEYSSFFVCLPSQMCVNKSNLINYILIEQWFNRFNNKLSLYKLMTLFSLTLFGFFFPSAVSQTQQRQLQQKKTWSPYFGFLMPINQFIYWPAEQQSTRSMIVDFCCATALRVMTYWIVGVYALCARLISIDEKHCLVWWSHSSHLHTYGKLKV